jgi:hypothetical protein
MANYNAIKYNGFSKGTLKLIKTLTASSSATLSFVNGASDVVLDSTYKEYIFIFNDIHPSAQADFTFQGSTNTGSSYGVTATTTYFKTYHNEAGDSTALAYDSERDEAQSTNFLKLNYAITNDNDSSNSGFLRLFSPSSTTFVKHFVADNQGEAGTNSLRSFVAGYFNTTSAVDAIQFKMSTGNIDAGTVQLFGVT